MQTISLITRVTKVNRVTLLTVNLAFTLLIAGCIFGGQDDVFDRLDSGRDNHVRFRMLDYFAEGELYSAALAWGQGTCCIIHPSPA